MSFCNFSTCFIASTTPFFRFLMGKLANFYTFQACNLNWNFLENFGRNLHRQSLHLLRRTKNVTLSNSTKRNQKTRTRNRSVLWTLSSLTVPVHPTRSGNENCHTILKIAEKCSAISDTKGPEAITRWSDFIAKIYGIESSKNNAFRYKRLSISISLYLV